MKMDPRARWNNKELNWSCERKWFVARPPTKWIENYCVIVISSIGIHKSAIPSAFIDFSLLFLFRRLDNTRSKKRFKFVYGAAIDKWCYWRIVTDRAQKKIRQSDSSLFNSHEKHNFQVNHTFIFKWRELKFTLQHSKFLRFHFYHF